MTESELAKLRAGIEGIKEKYCKPQGYFCTECGLDTEKLKAILESIEMDRMYAKKIRKAILEMK